MLRALLTARMNGLEPPETVSIKDISLPLWHSIEHGSTSLIRLAKNLDAKLISRHSHWLINVADQVQSISDSLRKDDNRAQHVELITGAVSKVKERI